MRSLTRSVIVLAALTAPGTDGCIVAAEVTVEEAQDTTRADYGAHLDGEGWVHFAVFSPHAERVTLLLYDDPAATEPAHAVPMNQHGDDWRIRVRGRGVGAGLAYMYRAAGSRDVSPADVFGRMFNDHYPLNDPYAYDGQDVSFTRVFKSTPFVDTTESLYMGGGKSLVYDHSRDADPGHVSVRPEDLIVYELHVQDYTARIQTLDPSKRGNYLGLAEGGLKTEGGLAAGIDHLVELGVTAVELMPIMEYDQDTGNEAGRLNHWGYMTTNFFAPETRYASRPQDAIVELKQMIKAFHDRGIAVIIDAVYNHTGEGRPWQEDGRLAAKYYNFRGLCNTRFYRPTDDGRFYVNNSGTGNDVDFRGGADRFSKRLATESMELWHEEYGVDGFRFDLARILADGSDNAADWVDNDPDYLAAHLHAEPWDNAGAWFDFMDTEPFGHHNNRWAKWIGRYRDSVRNFSSTSLNNRTAFKRLIEGRGDNGSGAAASSRPWRSVNFLAVHDGYTLRDCVSFQEDGSSHNCWDSGGDENLRRERQKLMLGVLLTSHGVPLILQGDEFGRTKAGALSQEEVHNTYNYESTAGDPSVDHVNWIDWSLKDGDNSQSVGGPTYGNELFHWTRDLILLRRKWSHFRREDFPAYAAAAHDGGADQGVANDGRYTYSFEGPGDGEPTQLAVIWWGQVGEPDLMVVYNENHLEMSVPNLADWSRGDWRVLARSWFGGDFDFCEVDDWQSDCPDAGSSITVKGRSMAILISDND